MMKKYDLIVVGGGFAGFGAAVGAAREGEQVTIIFPQANITKYLTAP